MDGGGNISADGSVAVVHQCLLAYDGSISDNHSLHLNCMSMSVMVLLFIACSPEPITSLSK